MSLYTQIMSFDQQSLLNKGADVTNIATHEGEGTDFK